MRKIILALGLLTLINTSFAQSLDRSKRPEPGPAKSINLGDAQSFVLPNGLKVFVVENHKLPTISASIILDVRPELEGPKAGISSLVGPLITSGTKSRSKSQFDEEVDMIAARISASSTSISGGSLVKHADKLFELMSDALINADFKQTELERLVLQYKSALSMGENNAESMMSNVKSVVLYGKNHPYGEVETPKTYDNITLNDVKAYYQTYFRPNVAYLAIVGDIKFEDAKKLVTEHFGQWKDQQVPMARYPAAIPPQETELSFVSRDGAVQSVIEIAYPINLLPGHEDVIKTRALNQILGGGMQGRLFLNLREDKGWTYGSYSSISSDDIVGNVSLHVMARNVVTDSSIAEMKKEMHTIRNEKVSAEELQSAKNAIIGSFSRGLESPSTIARFAIMEDMYRLPKGYYKNYIKNVEKLTVDDLHDAAQKYITPEKAHIIVVGNPTELDKLKRFSATGEVKYYDAYGNETQPREDRVIDGVSSKDVISKYVQAIGGESAIKSIENLTVLYSMNQMGQTINIQRTIVTPDKYKELMVADGVQVSRKVFDGEKGISSGMGGQSKEMDADDIAELREEMDIQSILHPDKYGIRFYLQELDEVDGKPAYVVEKLSNDGANKAIQYYDVASGLLVRSITTMEMQGQTMTVVTDYKDYVEVSGGNGYKIPETVSQTMMGQVMKMELSNVRVNRKRIRDSEFKL
ncbi:MAG TPA: pitrilysin family protein [Chitinophagaceae bacterium]|nr:pitrilysin family protein [Chitinophagaceae bacterium]